MQLKSVIYTSILAALVSASIDPLTVTSLSPAQSSAYLSANSAYLDSLTNGPAITSLAAALATDTKAFGDFTSAGAELATIQPTGSAAVEAASSLIDKLPPAAASFYNSVLSAEISLASSVVNNGKAAASGATSSLGAAMSSLGADATSALSSLSTSVVGTGTSGSAAGATASGSGAQPTNAMIQVGGAALAMFGAVVAAL